jgi:DNA-binding MarR family transcriptional regulator
VVLTLQRTTHHTLHALSAALAGENLSAAEINVLANLGDGGPFSASVGQAAARPLSASRSTRVGQAAARPLSVRELSDRTGSRASTLTGVLDRLENRGYLTRELDPADRRSFRLPLTEAGQAVASRVLTAVADLERDALAGLSATQIAGYHAVVIALQEAG